MRLDRNKRTGWLLASLGLAAWSIAAEARELRDPVAIGSAEVHLFGFKLYDARLMTPGGRSYDPGQPHALELRYARSFDREALLRATRKELRRIQGSRGVDAAMETLRPCFRDVSSGDRFKATAFAPNSLSFHLNGTQTCVVQGPGLARQFLSIWLSDEARDPGLSRELRGVGAGR